MPDAPVLSRQVAYPLKKLTGYPPSGTWWIVTILIFIAAPD